MRTATVCAWALTALTTLAAAWPARAQFGRPADFDPTNRNGGLRRGLADVDRDAGDALPRHDPQPHRPRPPLPGQRNALPVDGPPADRAQRPRHARDHVRLRARGGGSFKSYALHSGQTYYFRWVRATLAAPNDGVTRLLDLYRE